VPEFSLSEKIALVTGSSRGIGRATALRLAEAGATVVVNYRQKARRADQVVAEITEAGGRALAVAGDITDAASRSALFGAIREQFGRLDLLVLNASGGMEANMPADYALRLNRDAQVAMVQEARPLMTSGARIVYVTSHQAHFFGTAEELPEYVPVAQSKRAGEDALRALIPDLEEAGIGFVTVSGDMIVGTITAKLLERTNPGTMAAREAEVGHLLTVEEFADRIVEAAQAQIPADHTVLTGDVSDFLPNARA
jgi:NAD(P)-dependent dehydrogenase (short-subunit alcohol dehydrogenase family)